MNRKEKLMPNSVPKWIRCYDNGGLDSPNGRGSCDRYTVIYSHMQGITPGWCQYVSMSDSPYWAQGICQHGECRGQIDYPTYSHLGKKITFADLPEDCQKVVISDYCELWRIK